MGSGPFCTSSVTTTNTATATATTNVFHSPQPRRTGKDLLRSCLGSLDALFFLATDSPTPHDEHQRNQVDRDCVRGPFGEHDATRQHGQAESDVVRQCGCHTKPPGAHITSRKATAKNAPATTGFFLLNMSPSVNAQPIAIMTSGLILHHLFLRYCATSIRMALPNSRTIHAQKGNIPKITNNVRKTSFAISIAIPFCAATAARIGLPVRGVPNTVRVLSVRSWHTLERTCEGPSRMPRCC